MQFSLGNVLSQGLDKINAMKDQVESSLDTAMKVEGAPDESAKKPAASAKPDKSKSTTPNRLNEEQEKAKAERKKQLEEKKAQRKAEAEKRRREKDERLAKEKAEAKAREEAERERAEKESAAAKQREKEEEARQIKEAAEREERERKAQELRQKLQGSADEMHGAGLLQEATAQISDLQTKLQEAEAEAQGLRDENHAQQAHESALQAKLAQVEKAGEAAVADTKKEMEGKLEELEEANATLSDEAVSLKDTLATRERQLEERAAALADALAAGGEGNGSGGGDGSGGAVALQVKCRELEEELEQLQGEAEKNKRKVATARKGIAELATLREKHAKVTAELESKDQEFEQLMREGQKLSEKQGGHDAVVRKMRAVQEKLEKEGEADKATIVKHEQKIATLNEKITSLEAEKRQALDSAKEEKKRASRASSLEAELAAATAELQVTSAKASQLQSEVESNAELQLQALENQKVVEAQGFESAAEMSKWRMKEEHYLQEQRELRRALSSLQQEAGMTEDRLSLELDEARQKWQDAELRISTMGSKVSEATQPLQRQISALESDQRARMDAWASVESTLTQRAVKAEALARDATEQARKASDKLQEELSAASERQVEMVATKGQISRAQSEVSSLKARKAELQADLEATRKRLEEHAHAARKAAQESKLAASELRRELVQVQEKSDMAILQAETDKHEFEAKLSSAQRELTRALQRSGSGSGSTGTGLLSQAERREHDQRQAALMAKAPSQAELLQQSLAAPARSSSLGRQSSGSGTVQSIELERLQRLVKSKDTELVELKRRAEQLQKARDKLADETVAQDTRLVQYQQQVAKLPLVKKQLESYAQKQAVLLDLLGEKEEELEELQAKYNAAVKA